MVVLPKYDEFFKGIFRNETVRRHFIGDVLGISQEDIRCVELKNTFLWKRCWRQKLGILDVVLELNGSRKVNIELQVKPVKDWDKRQLFYLSRLYSEELGAGGKYNRLKKCVGISILDFNLTDRKEYHSVYRLRDQKWHEFSDVLEVHVIELKKELTGHGELEDWIRFFNVKREEDLKMIKTKNPGILEAIGELQRMNMSNPLRVLFEGYQKKWRDQMAREDYVREEGMTVGKAEGKAEGELLLAQLISCLLSDKRMDDIKLATEDEAARKRLYKEYGLEKEEEMQDIL